ncbi:acyl-CoA dehydrogenase [Gordonia sp. TBRC 11910]|uniref:Acyl-CoA dehydrogenase n=1 Tax=Gordonia asplenii TaxID=2725283 RepID=A0A848KVP1_9ACTN|nr:acyl-CoA dehydrogenase family protein [Gordonia asplenii]NMO02924.1 acyl-CoA dehydrogenase [Gordonia asplenii]
MDFELSPTARDYLARLNDFMDEYVYPAEDDYASWRMEQGHNDHRLPPIVESLKKQARAQGLWNLFLPDVSGLSVLDYAPLAEVTGRSPDIAPEALNCAAPDTGNMEILHLFGTGEQKHRWLRPLLDGDIRSAFAMTEPDVASSDANNIATTIRRDGDDYVIDGHKWWTSGIADPNCAVLLVLGKSNPDGPRHRQHSLILVPADTPGIRVVRDLPIFGYHDQHGHGEVYFDEVRVPAANLLGGEGDGFALAQGRLGPGRIHHCMRVIGMAERALELACRRAHARIAFGKPMAELGAAQHQIAECRLAIDQARHLVLHAAWKIDKYGAKHARGDISAVKIVAPRVACDVIDRAIQIHGGKGVTDDTPLAGLYARARAMRIFDGPDDVHLRSVAKNELAKYS